MTPPMSPPPSPPKLPPDSPLIASPKMVDGKVIPKGDNRSDAQRQLDLRTGQTFQFILSPDH